MHVRTLRLFASSMCLFLGVVTLLLAIIPAQTVSAKGEKYRWTGANTIQASDGNYAKAINLSANPSGGKLFTGTIVMGNTKCNRTVDLLLDSNTKATIRVYTDPGQSAGQNCGPTTGPFGGAYDSPVDVPDPNNLSGDRTGEGSNTDTNDPTNTTGEETTVNGDSDVCPVNETSALRWIICPLAEIGDQTIGSMQGFIMKFLFTPVDPVFDGIQKSADSFRNFGLGLLAIAALFMIVSSALGFER